MTPRAGLLWRPLPELSLYASYTENFGANNGLTSDGLALPPESVQQYEVGVKTEFYDGRLSGTLALFDITKQNVARADPSNPLFTVVTGEVRHRGVEVDVAGEVAPGWQIIGSYAYLDSEITKDSQQVLDPDTGEVIGVNDGNTGNRGEGTPRHAASLWSTYDIEQGLLKGLKLGAGMVARSQNFAGAGNNDLRLPGYVTAGLLLGYERKLGASQVSFQFNIENLLDKTYFESSGANVTAFYGAPRTFLGQVRVEW